MVIPLVFDDFRKHDKFERSLNIDDYLVGPGYFILAIGSKNLKFYKS